MQIMTGFHGTLECCATARTVLFCLSVGSILQAGEENLRALFSPPTSESRRHYDPVLPDRFAKKAAAAVHLPVLAGV